MAQTTLEERVAVLELQVAQLIGNARPPKTQKNWQATFGMFADDPEFDDVLQLGQEIRQQETDEEQGHAGA